MKRNQVNAASRPAPAALFLGLLLACWWRVAVAQEPAEVERQLDAIRQQIEALEEELSRDTGARDQLTRDLRAVETEIGRLAGELRRLDAELDRRQRELDELRRRELEHETDLRRQRDTLAAQLRTAYAIGRQPLLKLLLNLEDIRAVGRTLVYFRYYSQARLEVIAALRENLTRLAAVRAQMGATRARIAAARETTVAEQVERAAQIERRRQLLDVINARIAGGEQELDRLGRDREHLEQLLSELRELFAAMPAGAEGLTPFSGQRGGLRWPLSGRALLKSGQDKPGGMSRQGVLFAAPRGTEVKVVSYGRVAYADWLRGFGLLAIVDHGEGYMSLYAFNESLYKEIGDWVSAGETIAAVGDSGGRDQPALYFELRHEGRPVDPSPWFTDKE